MTCFLRESYNYLFLGRLYEPAKPADPSESDSGPVSQLQWGIRIVAGAVIVLPVDDKEDTLINGRRRSVFEDCADCSVAVCRRNAVGVPCFEQDVADAGTKGLAGLGVAD